MMTLAFLVVSVITIFCLAIFRASLLFWTIGFVLLALLGAEVHILWVFLFTILAILVGLSCFGALRRSYIMEPILKWVRKILPTVSKTERIALEAGTVGWDGQLFSGTPKWEELRSLETTKLTVEEQDFLDGPTQELCSKINDWDIRAKTKDLPLDVWDFMKSKGFFGMLIPKEHGGLGFSAQAQSQVVSMIASRSPTVAITAMVPNSLGPGELLEKYGTQEQKDYYLPRLAKGVDMPCFALTGPTSGSDATNMRDIGVVCYGDYEGQRVLGLNLTWSKRYITLGPIATVLGLAFHMKDPDGLLKQEGHENGPQSDDIETNGDVGITLALIPTTHLGVYHKRRHYPADAPFQNGPTWGKDVFIPMDWVIGGVEQAGNGWQMLVDCLSVGRAISLPAIGTTASKFSARTTGAYARVRYQFGMPIGKMQGVTEPLSKIVGEAYILESARSVTCAMLDRGDKPSVISALFKYQATERMRQAINHAMDIHGGKGICDGPRNYLFASYQTLPVAITVEGANILTRTLITFAQGALRSHPYLQEEMEIAGLDEGDEALGRFDKAFGGHVAFMMSNMFAGFFHNLTGGHLAPVPRGVKVNKKWYKQVNRASRTFAFVADFIVTTMGGRLKREQTISGRMADALSSLYMMSTVLKRFEDDGAPKEDEDVVSWCLQHELYQFGQALKGVFEQLPKGQGCLLRLIAFPIGVRYTAPKDSLGHHIAQFVQAPTPQRDRLTRGLYHGDGKDAISILETTFKRVCEDEALIKKLNKAIRRGEVETFYTHDILKEAQKAGILDEIEAERLKETYGLIDEVIAVDSFEATALTTGNFPQTVEQRDGIVS